MIAPQASKHSRRPVETITPTATPLNLEISDKYSDSDHEKRASDILTDSATYGRKTVLICWHHGNIPNLALTLGVPKD